MTFPQIPLGDDGELDIEDSREFPALHSYKLKPSLLQKFWPLIVVVFVIMLNSAYHLIGQVLAIPTAVADYEHTFNYQLTTTYQMVGIWVCMITPILNFLGIISLLLTLWRSNRSLLRATIILVASLIACGVCALSSPPYQMVHKQTIVFENKRYHLVLLPGFIDNSGEFFVLKCDDSDIFCQSKFSGMYPISDEVEIKVDNETNQLYVETFNTRQPVLLDTD